MTDKEKQVCENLHKIHSMVYFAFNYTIMESDSSKESLQAVESLKGAVKLVNDSIAILGSD